jgi:hypothetical protein
MAPPAVSSLPPYLSRVAAASPAPWRRSRVRSARDSDESEERPENHLPADHNPPSRPRRPARLPLTTRQNPTTKAPCHERNLLTRTRPHRRRLASATQREKEKFAHQSRLRTSSKHPLPSPSLAREAKHFKATQPEQASAAAEKRPTRVFARPAAKVDTLKDTRLGWLSAVFARRSGGGKKKRRRRGRGKKKIVGTRRRTSDTRRGQARECPASSMRGAGGGPSQFSE